MNGTPSIAARDGEEAITVLVPAYRPGPWIDRLLASLAAQEGGAFRVALSIDDCDAAAESAVRHAVVRHLPEHSVSITAQPTRLGWVDNTNALLRQATTRFVCVLPQDDYVGPGYLASLREAHARHPGAAATYPDIRYEGRGYERWRLALTALWSGGRRHPLHRWRRVRTVWREGIVLRSPSLLGDRHERVQRFLRSCFCAVTFRGLVDTRVMGRHLLLRHGRDHDFAADSVWMLAMADRGPLIRVPEARYHKCIHAENTHLAWHRLETDQAWRRWLAHCQDCYQQMVALGWPEGNTFPYQSLLVQRLWQSNGTLWPQRPLPALPAAEKPDYVRALMAGVGALQPWQR